MSTNDELGKRMKEHYEQIPKTKLMRRTPVAIRIDGKAFHTFTRDFDKPFDEVLMKTMQETTFCLCENIQGCVFGYTQSDEITLILQDYKKLTTDAWFDYEVQKICSIAASMATMYFNQLFSKNVELWHLQAYGSPLELNLSAVYDYASVKGAMFDARCFNIPKEEVANLLYWRQLDATRNSIQMVGQANFSHKELQGKSCNDIQDMLLTEKNINWNNYSSNEKKGTAIFKAEDGWTIDYDTPKFNDNWNYINKHIYFESEVE